MFLEQPARSKQAPDDSAPAPSLPAPTSATAKPTCSAVLAIAQWLLCGAAHIVIAVLRPGQERRSLWMVGSLVLRMKVPVFQHVQLQQNTCWRGTLLTRLPTRHGLQSQELLALLRCEYASGRSQFCIRMKICRSQPHASCVTH